ncbi:MAG: tryptophan synthase subunit alpha [Pseudomonadales bacterium]|nr:tryptophan synthase subunit alpha [Pseudomonadales bacterium]
MSRIAEVLKEKRAHKAKALIPYLVAGDPDLQTTVRLMHALVSAGADIIELGIPFSDPSSDGTIIQLGAERALAGGTRLLDVLAVVSQFRQQDTATPVVLMGYLNPIEAMGYQQFALNASQAGVDGVLVVDMPVNESADFFAAVKPFGLDTVFLVAPTTSDARLLTICQACSGYLYYVSLKGVTGAAIRDKGEIRIRIEQLRGITDLPVVVGFGIKDSRSAQEMASVSDGIIVGSALVERIAQLSGKQGISESDITSSTELIAVLRKSIDNIK